MAVIRLTTAWRLRAALGGYRCDLWIYDYVEEECTVLLLEEKGSSQAG